MGITERYHVRRAQSLSEQLHEVDAKGWCVQLSLQAMGADIHFQDVFYKKDQKFLKASGHEYFASYGYEISATYEIPTPIHVSSLRSMLIDTKTHLSALHYQNNFSKKVAGVFISIGAFEDDAPHVIGVLPRNQMPRDVRNQLKYKDMHVVIDAGISSSPVYRMTSRNITDNINLLVMNNISVAMHVVTTLS